jgi:ligand-binding sensor domain-containing protein/signal transduction histidine kinase
MKLKIPLFTAILLFLLSCNRQREQTRPGIFTPKVVEAKGYIVPKDSMATPKTVLAGKPKVVLAGKPTVVATNTNIRAAGIPKTVIAGTPKICTPGKDSFLLPKVVPAINKPFVAGMPEVVIARDAGTKDQNAQNFSSFTKLQGLKSGVITCMLQDKSGNIWFGTYGGGVSRYDGKNFTHFTEKEGLSKNFVMSIFEDRSGNIWIGTRNRGISKYDGKNFTYFTENEGLSNNYAGCIIEDKSGNLWFGTGGGVCKYNGKTFTHFTEKEGLINNSVNSILEDKSGNLWFGTYGGVSKYDGRIFTNYTKKEGLGSDDVRSILEDRSGNLWFGTYDGISKYDGKTFIYFTEKEGLSSNHVLSILEDRSGNLWFGTFGGGASKYDGKYFTHFTVEEGLGNNTVNSILEDKSGDLWFGTDGGGISKYNGKTFTHFTRNEGLSNNDIWSIFQDKSGNLWFGTFGGGAVKYDGKTFTHFTEKEGLNNNDVWSILQDKSGNMWFGTATGGVSKFDGKTFTQYTEKEGLCSNDVRSILIDQSGNLWVGTYDKGVSKYDGKTFTHFTKKEGLSNNEVFNIFEDRSGNLWFGTREGGVAKYDGKTFTHFTVKEGLSNNTISGILEDKAGNMWFGTIGGGVSRLDRDGRTFTHFTEKEGLSNNDVWSIFEDRSGNFWFGTAFGLNKLTQQALLKLSAYATVSTDKVNLSDHGNNDWNEGAEKVLFKTYSYEDGFLGIGCNMHAIFEDKNGTIWIGTNDRLTAYNPEGDKRDTIAPNIQLTNIALFNENITWTKDTSIVLGNGVSVGHFEFDSLSGWYNIPENLSLTYNNNYLTFNFIGITTKSPQKVKYQYKLEGLDKNWSALTTRTEAAYGNLPHGNYSFKVKAMNSEGYWSREFKYSFTIRPPWWQTWWAYSIYSLLFIAGVYGIHRFQRERLLRAERERTRERELEQAKEIEKAYQELKPTQSQLIQSETMASLGELTAGIAHEIQNPLNFVNNFSEVNAELIAEMKQEIDKGNMEEVKTIANDIEENEQKIIHHGKRADAIVKGMLQHSRSDSGVKEPTDINALADEYLRLAYHGLRAKNKTFNATLRTDFDESTGKINIVPQDMGRVLLNLYNNAFYAVTERKKQQGEGYEPTVSVSTKSINDKSDSYRIEIRVKDNGNGIPQKVVDKIFQPFFTTKPTGQGTGLGLSLSYDIIKAHGGEIRVETKEREGSEFVIVLPTK